jgi:5-methylcytosine-specific restriction enzyme A
MAVTQGHGNPDWSRDEVILALDLYFRCAGSMPGPNDPRVVELSKILRALPLHKDAAKNDRFRNPAGVAFKLQNIRQVASEQGLNHTSATDRAVWADYGKRPERVAELAALIREQAEGVDAVQVEELDEDEVFVEGRLLTAVHRERDRRARKMLLKKRQQLGRLTCDVCGHGPKVSDPELAAAGFEAHHLLPLATTGPTKTKLADLALLCAVCHRLIHRAMHLRRGWVSVEDFSREVRTTDAGPA